MFEVRKICLEYKLHIEIVLPFICCICVVSLKLYCCSKLGNFGYKTVAVVQVAEGAV